MLNATNGRLKIAGSKMDYIKFGTGRRTLIVLPGVGDGIRSIRGTAQLFALMFNDIVRDYTVYSFSRRLNLPKNMTTRQMAEDQCIAMNKLGITKASVCGISQGGMIAQWMAIDHPDMIENLVLAVTMCHPNQTIQGVVSRWVDMAQNGEYQRLMIDNSDLSYVGGLKTLYRYKNRLLGNIGRPRSFERFITEADSCLKHDTREHLSEIKCPTLVIGGTDDQIVSGEASVELASLIPGSKLYMYEGLGHGLYEEAWSFHKRVATFCLSES